MDEQKIRIAVAGRSNVGKTSLIRTVLKSSVGEVADRPDVTLSQSDYSHDSLQAVFVDTPGIRSAKSCNLYLKITRSRPGEPPDDDLIRDFMADQPAIDAIQNSHVVIYVCDLNVVPDAGFLEEMKMVQALQPNAVGLLNQLQKLRKSFDDDDSRVNSRVRLWVDALKQSKIDSVVLFDCHYDSYLRVSDIYRNVEAQLHDVDKPKFADGVRKFEEREEGIRRHAVKLLYDLLESLSHVSSKTTVSESAAVPHRANLERAALDAVEQFKGNVQILFDTASGNPSWPLEVLLEHVKLTQVKNARARLETGAKGATVGAAIGTAIGGLVGFCIGGVPLAVMTAKASAAACAFVGTAGCFIPDSDLQLAKISDAKVGDFVFNGLVEIWGHSVIGYSRDHKLSVAEVANIRASVEPFYEDTRFEPLRKIPPEVESFIEAGTQLLAEVEKEWELQRRPRLSWST